MAGDNYWFGGGATGSTIFGGYSTSGAVVYYNSGDQAAVAAAQAQAYAEYKVAMEKAIQREYVMRELLNLMVYEDVEGTLV